MELVLSVQWRFGDVFKDRPSLRQEYFVRTIALKQCRAFGVVPLWCSTSLEYVSKCSFYHNLFITVVGI